MKPAEKKIRSSKGEPEGWEKERTWGGRRKGRKEQGEEGVKGGRLGEGRSREKKDLEDEGGIEDGIIIGRRPVEVGDNSWHRE